MWNLWDWTCNEMRNRLSTSVHFRGLKALFYPDHSFLSLGIKKLLLGLNEWERYGFGLFPAFPCQTRGSLQRPTCVRPYPLDATLSLDTPVIWKPELLRLHLRGHSRDLYLEIWLIPSGIHFHPDRSNKHGSNDVNIPILFLLTFVLFWVWLLLREFKYFVTLLPDNGKTDWKNLYYINFCWFKEMTFSTQNLELQFTDWIYSASGLIWTDRTQLFLGIKERGGWKTDGSGEDTGTPLHSGGTQSG